MAGVARFGDVFVGICTCHPTPYPAMVGTITIASGDVKANGQGVARTGDLVIGACGHVGLIVSSSGTVKANGQGVARMGDVVAGCLVGAITTGSGDVNTP